MNYLQSLDKCLLKNTKYAYRFPQINLLKQYSVYTTKRVGLYFHSLITPVLLRQRKINQRLLQDYRIYRSISYPPKCRRSLQAIQLHLQRVYVSLKKFLMLKSMLKVCLHCRFQRFVSSLIQRVHVPRSCCMISKQKFKIICLSELHYLVYYYIL